jgi:hypothetical protein
MKVNLSPVDMYKVLHYSSVVYETKRINQNNKSVTNHRFSEDIDDYGMHLIGYMGEAAVCHILGKEFQVDVSKYGDDGHDLRYCGFSMQIKTISRDYGEKNTLYVNAIDEVKSDILVGVAITGPASVRVYGAITKDKFKRHMYSRNFGYGDRDCVDQQDLPSVQKMMEFFNKALELT